VIIGCGASERDTSTGSRDIPGVLLLDNAEDGDNTSLPDETLPFNGYWYTFDDRHECKNADKGGSTLPLPTPDGGGEFMMSAYDATNPPPQAEGAQGENKLGIRFWGGGHTYWGAGVGVALNNQAGSLLPIDIAPYGFEGVRFWARNAVGEPVNVKVQITDGWAENIHGQCVPQDEALCNDQGCFNAAFDTFDQKIGPEWTLVTVPFAGMMRESWGKYQPGLTAPDGVELTTAYQLQVKVDMVPQFDLWIDNIGFYGGPSVQ
jgi:hypothetical protein